MSDPSIFRDKYVYVRAEPNDGPRTLNITIFGLHEKSGLYIFEKIFKGTVKETSKLQDHEYDEKNGVSCKVRVIVRPSQYADHLFYKTAIQAFRKFDEIASFLLVFDANFVRFSSDVKSAMIKFEVISLRCTVTNKSQELFSFAVNPFLSTCSSLISIL